MQNTPTDSKMVSPSGGTLWHVRAAKMSWMFFIVGFVVNMKFGKDRSYLSIAVGVLVFAIFLAGLVAAVWAIVRAFRTGPKNILAHAAFGLILNGWVMHVAYRTYQSTQLEIEQRRAEERLATSNDWIPVGEGWYVDRGELFAIRFPESWIVKEQPNPKVAVAAYSPLNLKAIKVSELLTVSVGRVSILNKPTKILAREIETMAATDGYQKRNSGTMTINGVDWTWVTYRLPIRGIDSLVTSYLAIRNTRLYVVSKIVLFEDPDAWANEIGESIDSVIIPDAKRY